MKIAKKGCKRNLEISIENYLIKWKIKRESILVIDKWISQKNLKKNCEDVKKTIATWKNNFILCMIYKMSKQISTFDDIEVKKSAFVKSKYPIDINEVDIKQILISDKVSYGKKRLYILYWLKRWW